VDGRAREVGEVEADFIAKAARARVEAAAERRVRMI
jgi:hypothetical protein